MVKKKRRRKGGTSLELPQGAKNPHFHYRGHGFESWSGRLESCMLQPKHNVKKIFKMLFKKENHLNPNSTLHTKINSRWNISLNVKVKNLSSSLKKKTYGIVLVTSDRQ